MAAESTSTLDGWFKTRYADKAAKLVPEFVILPRYFKFNSKKKTGDTYQCTARVRRSFGWTWAGSGTSGTAFALNDAVAGQTKPANVGGTEFVARSQIPYSVIKRAQGSEQAFGDAFDEIVQDMTEGAHFAREINLLYGGTNIGDILSVGAVAGAGGAWTKDCVITVAGWAPGLWSQAEGMPIDVYTAGGVKRNTAYTMTVTAIDPDTRTVTITSVETPGSVELTAVAATDVILPQGAYGNWFTGLHTIAQNTGTLFGINAATYSLWGGNSYGAGSAAATMAKFTKAVIPTVTRGGMDKVTFFCSTSTWADLNNDHAALRRFSESTKSGLNLGTNKITYYGPNGEIEIVPHPMVKQGYAYGLQTKRWERIGSTDVTFDLGVEGSQNRFFQQLSGNAGSEIRCYWDQALFCRAPARQVVMSGIVNSA